MPEHFAEGYYFLVRLCPLLAAVALLAFSGCQSGAFTGLTRVPPPATGSVSAGQPYYQPSAAQVDLTPAAVSPSLAAEMVPSLAAGAAPSLAPTAAIAPTLAAGQVAPENLDLYFCLLSFLASAV